MSSMGRKTVFSLALMVGTALAFPSLAQAQDASRSSLVAQQPGRMDQAVGQWEYLTKQENLPFSSYADFLTSYPDFPKQELLQRRAEAALDSEAPTPQTLVAFFDKHPPLTNSGRARYALALASLDRPEALEVAREAWRGGTMSGPAELYMQGLFGSRFAPEDHDARMDALLWQGSYEAASRHVVRVSPAYRPMAQARLAPADSRSSEKSLAPRATSSGRCPAIGARGLMGSGRASCDPARAALIGAAGTPVCRSVASGERDSDAPQIQLTAITSPQTPGVRIHLAIDMNCPAATTKRGPIRASGRQVAAEARGG